MSHDLTQRYDGTYEVFVARTDAWHKLGVRVENCLTAQEAIIQGRLNWTVSKRPLFSQVDYGFTSLEEEGIYGVYRDDTGKFLGSVGGSYTPVQNKYMFDFTTALIESDGAHFESAGSLLGGAVVFLSAALDTILVCGVDEQKGYLNFLTSHNGRYSTQAYLSSLRQVCHNTVQLALSNKLSSTMRARHTKNAERKLDQARGFMRDTRLTYQALKDKFEFLAQRLVPVDVQKAILADLFPASDVRPGRSDSAKREVENLYEYNDNNAFPEFRGTGYNLLNAIVEYTDFTKGVRKTDKRDTDSTVLRAESSILGSGATLKDKAMETITRYCETLPERPRPIYSVGAGQLTCGTTLMQTNVCYELEDISVKEDEPLNIMDMAVGMPDAIDGTCIDIFSMAVGTPQE